MAGTLPIFPGTEGYDRAALFDVMLEFRPVITGDYDIRDVRWMLGTSAGIYPERVRGEDAPALAAQLRYIRFWRRAEGHPAISTYGEAGAFLPTAIDKGARF